jgi:hypothetical protein
MKDDSTCHVGTLVRLTVLLECEARRLGIDIEQHTHAITDRLRDFKHGKERHETQNKAVAETPLPEL